MDSLEKKIYEKIVEKMDVDEAELEGFDENCPIFGDPEDGEVSMGLDSIDSLELVVILYDEWKIKVPSEDIELLTTVKNVADYVREHGQI